MEHRSFGAPHHTHTNTLPTRTATIPSISPSPRPQRGQRKESHRPPLGRAGPTRRPAVASVCSVGLFVALFACPFCLLCLSPVVLPDVFVLSAFCCCLCLNDANSARTGLFILSNQGRHKVKKKMACPFNIALEETILQIGPRRRAAAPRQRTGANSNLPGDSPGPFRGKAGTRQVGRVGRYPLGGSTNLVSRLQPWQ